MMHVTPTDSEVTFEEDDIIVSKTDLKGRITYANRKNMSKNGDYYWVFAHVTPSFDVSKQVVGFHSSRRVPDRRKIESSIVPLYAAALAEERRHRNGQQALAASYKLVLETLKSKNMSYDELIFSI